MKESQLVFTYMLIAGLFFDVAFLRNFFVRNSRKSVRKFLSEVVLPKPFRSKVFYFNAVEVMETTDYN